ncbi:cytochrome c biogenesis protein [Jatrophihabitans sp. GAS493]|uniref:cytochrome c biogenesis protein ResB n=1 Tax=Jatrophihabitans sp. GAS493 TaxID=1907575 RepID=UPI000BB7CB57|nr:cytochrome c biogenesis protein ResB [Jatrophihabitans sp. GAS493]SOD70632.1 cytochrome c biogenesis protein [Jatrophihabitans sp. GAS493]
MNPIRVIRRAWRRLISMRTALILLFLLAVAAVPGSLLPQRPLNPVKVQAYLASHGAWGTFLDRIGMFDVFGTPWFAAIYLLLFISLVGCLIPRIRLHLRNATSRPLKAPKNLDRLPESARLQAALPVEEYAVAARRTLGRRWRVERREEPGGVVTLSAEKGYTRETGNLVFHVALLCALVLIAIGRLFSYESSYLVEQGAGFCNGAFADSSRPGRLAAEGKVTPPPFCVNVTKFDAQYLADGQPSKFLASVTYQPNVNSTQVKATAISVNHPLRLEGDRVYLVGHGFSPSITVTMPDGTVYHRTADFVPTDAATLLSEGAFEVTQKSGTNEVGVEGFFAPTPVETSSGVYTSASPTVKDPMLGIFVYTGTLHPDGLPHSTSSLDKTDLTKTGQANLRIGESTTAKGVKVTFDGWVPWVTLQVSHDPSQTYLLFAAGAMVIGLVGSLSVRRRRIWLRITPAASGSTGSPTVISIGGLARSDAGNFSAEFASLLAKLAQKTGASSGPAGERIPATDGSDLVNATQSDERT